MRGKFVLVIALTASLTACATSKDPREGGFIGGLYGLSSGAYDHRIHQKEEELTQQQNIKDELQEKSKQLGSEAQEQDLMLITEQQRMAKMNDELSRLESEMDQLNAKSADQEKEITTIKNRIESLRHSLEAQQSALADLERNGGSSADPERYRTLEKERDRLAEEYRNLVEYFQALSEATN